MRRTVLVTLLIAALALVAGCGKDKEKVDLRSQVATLQEQVTQLETETKDLKNQLDQATLKMTDEKRQGEDLEQALDVRLLHHPLTEFTISPSAATENGWLILDGQRTFTLSGHEGATKVVFYWAQASDDFKPQQLAVDSNGEDGWSWSGALPSGNMRAFWAEVQYPGGVKVQSGVLPLRSSGK